MYAQEEIKPYNNTEKKGKQIETMFNNIAPSYDFLNHFLSMGIDKIWRRKTIQALSNFPHETILDIATGTGDFAILAHNILHAQHITACDISQGMMDVGKEKVAKLKLDNIIHFQQEDCMHLSFADNSYDLITSAYGVRNFENLKQGLQEMLRVLKPGGHIAILELCTPKQFPMKQLFWLYAHVCLPIMGTLVSKDDKAYTYLNDSIEAFPQGELMQKIMQEVGFKNATFKRFTFGISTMYIAEKG